MKKIALLVLSLPVLFFSCATLNHGKTLNAGELQVTGSARLEQFKGSIHWEGFSSNSAVSTVSSAQGNLLYGVTDQFNLGLAGNYYTNTDSEPTLMPYMLYNFKTSGFDTVFGAGAVIYGDTQDGKFNVLGAPALSIAVSKELGILRPYTGLQFIAYYPQFYTGAEISLGNLILDASAEVTFTSSILQYGASAGIGYKFGNK